MKYKLEESKVYHFLSIKLAKMKNSECNIDKDIGKWEFLTIADVGEI